MIGLPGESTITTVSGAKSLAQLQPDFVRIYPTLVIKGSGLEQLYHSGRYHPLSLNKAVTLTARLTQIFAEKDIAVIRAGLQSNLELEAHLIAGPYHPAFGELVKARRLFHEVRRKLHDYRNRPCRITIAIQDQSLLTGNKEENLLRLKRLGLLDHATIIFKDLGGQRGKVLMEEVD